MGLLTHEIGTDWEPSAFPFMWLPASCCSFSFELMPGLPAASIIPDSAKRGQPACTGVGTVIKVGPNSIWREFLQFLLFLFFKKFFIGGSYWEASRAVLLLLDHPWRCGTFNPRQRWVDLWEIGQHGLQSDSQDGQGYTGINPSENQKGEKIQQIG